MAMVAPRAAKALAVAWPMPLVAPVTSTVWPAIGCCAVITLTG
jgi:hypothetical protein